MADTAIAITAGSGTNVDTRTEGTNGNHRQVVVLGDPATNDGVAPVDSTNGLAVELKTALPAGTNAIGKLGANSGVDIGDVDVTSVSNGALNGPAEPTIDSYTQAVLSADVGANNVVVASPGASKQIWVYGIAFTVDTFGTSVTFQDEDDTAITGTMLFGQYGGMSVSPSGNFAQPLWKVATNKALEVDLVTGDIDGTITYAVVSV